MRKLLGDNGPLGSVWHKETNLLVTMVMRGAAVRDRRQHFAIYDDLHPALAATILQAIEQAG